MKTRKARMNTWLATVGSSLVLAATVQAQIVIYADSNDGMLENRSEWTTGPDIQNTDDWSANVGEWYGTGLTTAVFPFQLPDLGPINNPFATADFGVNLFEKGDATVTDVDLYGVRVDASPLISSNDWYNGSSPDPNATLLQAGFLTPSSSTSTNTPNNFTDASGSSNLVSYLNAVYDGGAGAGKYVFLRLSYASDSYASGWDAYKMTTRNAGLTTDWPVITLTTVDRDTDGDGLPDVWESEHGLDPSDNGSVNINNGAIGDPDMDNLVNSNEYALGTDPQNPDTDGDGLTDGAEVHTYGSNPLNTDTDGDGLSDGDEVNTYGTNPLVVDTDGDGESDFFEVMQGSNPLDPSSNSTADGLVVIDGHLDLAYFDGSVAIQTVNSSWPTDNEGELDAAYATVQNGNLCLFFAGNIDKAYNKLNIFIDTSDAITTNVLKTVGNDGTDVMDGLVFDTGFSPEYQLDIRRGIWGPNPGDANFNLDFSNLATSQYDSYQTLFGAGVLEGSAFTGTGNVNAHPIAVAYNGSNTVGVVSGTTAANVVDVLAVTNGLELRIALSDLGNPHGAIRIMAMICDASHAQISNQILDGLPAPAAALGTASNVDFSAIAGDQYFPVIVSGPKISSIHLLSGNSELQLELSDLVSGETYRLQDAAELDTASFSDVAGSEFTAGATNQTITVPVDQGTTSTKFFRAVMPYR